MHKTFTPLRKGEANHGGQRFKQVDSDRRDDEIRPAVSLDLDELLGWKL